MTTDADKLLGACAWPSEAYWRLLELAAIRQLGELRHPILEIGCGNGAFTELTGLQVDLAIDREANAVERAASRTAVYRLVRKADARDLDLAPGSFATVLANSVLEHVPNVHQVLERCRCLLEPGGRLVTTVPLVDMNDHLALRNRRYARVRQRQLEHRNLWPVDRWRAELATAGFASTTVIDYLDAGACRRWDAIDVLGAAGSGRYRLSTALHHSASVLGPERVKRRIRERLATTVAEWASRPAEGPFCAAVLVASTPT